jgi:dTDP-4-amino-4,6-dideoxygalactose transaminase
MRPARRKRDLVEEFWDEETLAVCRATAPRVRPRDFLDVLRAQLGATGRLWATPSGRVALRDFLSWTVPADRRCVLVCSLNCRAVTEAVQQAGMRVDTFDLIDTCGRIDWGTVAGQLRSWHGAVVVPHLFGVPTDLRPLLAAARAAGVLVVEDCAHTLGARIGPSVAGTLGDAAIFSFNYDKPISLGGGGVLLVNNPRLWPAVRAGWPAPGLAREERELRSFLRFMASRRGATTAADSAPRRMAVAFRHSRYGRLVHRVLPGLAQRSFPVTGIGPLRAALGLWQLERYAAVVEARNAHATAFVDRTGRGWHVDPGVHPAWLKQKATHPDLPAGRRVAESLRRRGLPVGTFNWSTTVDEHLGNPAPPNAFTVSRHSLDIPIHQNLRASELDVICAAFSG